MKIFYFLICFILMGCAGTPSSSIKPDQDPIFIPYLEQDQKYCEQYCSGEICNRCEDIIDVNIKFVDSFSDNSLKIGEGISDSGIEILRSYWDKGMTEPMKEMLVLHELGHAHFGFIHTTKETIMNKTLYEYVSEEFNNDKEHYLKLFFEEGE